jgi:hypothetical protein
MQEDFEDFASSLMSMVDRFVKKTTVLLFDVLLGERFPRLCNYNAMGWNLDLYSASI